MCLKTHDNNNKIFTFVLKPTRIARDPDTGAAERRRDDYAELKFHPPDPLLNAVSWLVSPVALQSEKNVEKIEGSMNSMTIIKKVKNTFAASADRRYMRCDIIWIFIFFSIFLWITNSQLSRSPEIWLGPGCDRAS